MNLNYTLAQWGPLLLKTEITEDLRLNILERSKGLNQPLDHRLSNLEEEYNFDDDSVNFLKTALQPYFDMYVNVYERNWSSNNIGNKKLTLVNAWINIQKQNEWRPPHYHSDCDASFVLYLDIPDLSKEINNLKDVDMQYCPGNIVFRYFSTDQHKDIFKSTDYLAYYPSNRDFIIFPANLDHYTNPFKTDTTRLSVSGNLKVI